MINSLITAHTKWNTPVWIVKIPAQLHTNSWLVNSMVKTPNASLVISTPTIKKPKESSLTASSKTVSGKLMVTTGLTSLLVLKRSPVNQPQTFKSQDMVALLNAPTPTSSVTPLVKITARRVAWEEEPVLMENANVKMAGEVKIAQSQPVVVALPALPVLNHPALPAPQAANLPPPALLLPLQAPLAAGASPGHTV